MHEQPVLQRLGYFADERHPVSEKIARRGFYVPSGLAITGEQIERSAAALKQILA
jgi:perosamine synthetase